MGAVQRWIESNTKRYKNRDKLTAAGANRFRVSRATFTDFLDGKLTSIYPSRKKGGPGSGQRTVTSRASKAGGLSVDEFMASHDLDTRLKLSIRDAIAKLPEDTIVPDAIFRSEHCRVSSVGWKAVSAEAEFSKNRFRVTGAGGGLYWATVNTVKQMLDRMPFKTKEA